jgi:hypothetical protein
MAARKRRTARLACALLALGGSWLGACVPEGPPGQNRSGGKPPAGPLSAVAGSARPPTASAITTPFEDHFDRNELGPDWVTLSPLWRVEEGELCAKGARNHGAWLKPAIPERARIEFDARSDSTDGDIKAELWGDGKTGATGSSYSNASSYLVILGGWGNTKHVLARLDEHGKDRLELTVDPEAPEPRALPVEPGQTYRFRVERTDEKTVSWWVDDHLVFELQDPEPLRGEGHDHFGFNEWAARVCFDNLKVTPL